MVTDNRRQFQRRRSGAQWVSENPVLAAGEIGVATGGELIEARVGDGTSAWTALLGPVGRLPLIFWRHTVNQTIPNNVWTPIVLNTLTSVVGAWSAYTAQSTTIGAGSNGAALPQGTINVATNGAVPFATSGYIVITIGGTHRLVQYTGKTASSFTGCTLGVGTMTTGDAVAQANVEFVPPNDGVCVATTEVAWASNATGVRGIRFFTNGGFPLPAGTDIRGAVATASPLLRSSISEQPGTAAPNRVEVFQNSGGSLDIVPDPVAAPRIVATLVSALAP